MDDRRYFTCVKHVQDTTSLPPIPVRFMERLVRTRLRSRMRCPSKYKVLVEKDDLKAEQYATESRLIRFVVFVYFFFAPRPRPCVVTLLQTPSPKHHTNPRSDLLS